MGYTAKIDALDFILNCLTDHEKTLDRLIARLERALNKGGL